MCLQELLDEAAAAGGAAGGGQDLQQGIGALMDAMRDLLNNIRPVPPPREGEEDQDEAEEGEYAADEEWD